MQESLDAELWFADVFGGLFIIFGVGALFLAAVGLYGVMSFSVKRRTQEVGIRMALGAQAGEVRGMVLKAGVMQVLVGLALGLGLGGLLSLAFQASIPMEPWDPRVFLGISAVLLTAATLATYAPARRATRVDPVAALRDG
jgi:ABC-type antimicrobial peptide transport system permease subunit